MEKISIQPSPHLIETLASSGYTLESAVGDIIDNSIDAGANVINIYFDYEKRTIKFIDNGSGMTEEEIRKASIPAYQSKYTERDNTDLGRFSLGLKSASASICDILSITSKKNNKTNRVIINFKNIVESKSWEATLEKNIDDSIISKNGTIIEWIYLKSMHIYLEDKKYFTQDILRVEKYISLTYSEIIKDGLSIFINEREVSAFDPFMQDNDKTKVVDQREIDFKGEIIRTTTFILPNLDSLDDTEKSKILSDGIIENQGFYIYRNKRLIYQGKWMGISNFKTDNKYQYARIKVDINNKLDEDFKINFMKNFATLPESTKEDFLTIAKKSRNESLNNFTYIKRRKQLRRTKLDDINYVWLVENTRDGQKLLINYNHPLIKEFSTEFGITKIKKLLSLFSKTIPISQIRQGGFANNSQLSDEEFVELFKRVNANLIKEGLTKEEIISKLIKIEPFNTNIEKLLELIGGFLNG
jgi:hypothetical protein